VLEVIVKKDDGFDLCLEDSIVKGLGFASCSNNKL